MSESKPHSMEVRLTPEEIEVCEGIAERSGLAFLLDHLGLDGLGNVVLDLHRRIRELEEQYEESRTATQKWYDEAHNKRKENARLLEQFDTAMDCMNYAWTIICNVSEGDWTKQRQEWQDAAARWRDQYHALLASNPAKERL